MPRITSKPTIELGFQGLLFPPWSGNFLLNQEISTTTACFIITTPVLYYTYTTHTHTLTPQWMPCALLLFTLEFWIQIFSSVSDLGNLNHNKEFYILVLFCFSNSASALQESILERGRNGYWTAWANAPATVYLRGSDLWSGSLIVEKL